MRMFFVCLCMLLFVGVSGCGGVAKPASVLVESSEEAMPKEQSIDLSSGTTIGNRTYLPINMYGEPADHVRQILRILDVFEKEHSEFELTSWCIENRQLTESTSAYIYGLWINHRPKK